MRLLYFIAYYPPEIAASLYLFENIATDVAKNGTKVDIISPNPVRGVDKETRLLYKNNESLRKQVIEQNNLTIHRLNLPFTEEHGLILRAVRYIIVTLAMFFKGLMFKPDIIFLTSTPPIILAIVCGIIGKIKKVPVVYTLQDIFPDSIVNSGTLRNKKIIAFFEFLEKSSYNFVDHIVTISEDFRDILIKKGVDSKKITVIPNWVEEEKVVPIKKEENILFERYNLDKNKFYITYCGNVGLTQNLELLIDVAKETENLENIHFVIIGQGENKDTIIKYANKKQVNNVTFLPFQPYEDIAHVFSLADVGLIISKKNIGTNSFPSKTWSIMSAKRAVLTSFDEDSELCSIINKSSCGVCVPPDNKESLKNAILKLYENKEITKKYGQNGRKYILDHLTREKGTSSYVKVFEDIMKKK